LYNNGPWKIEGDSSQKKIRIPLGLWIWRWPTLLVYPFYGKHELHIHRGSCEVHIRLKLEASNRPCCTQIQSIISIQWSIIGEIDRKKQKLQPVKDCVWYCSRHSGFDFEGNLIDRLLTFK
jgi:hypothetical protein